MKVIAEQLKSKNNELDELKIKADELAEQLELKKNEYKYKQQKISWHDHVKCKIDNKYKIS